MLPVFITPVQIAWTLLPMDHNVGGYPRYPGLGYTSQIVRRTFWLRTEASSVFSRKKGQAPAQAVSSRLL